MKKKKSTLTAEDIKKSLKRNYAMYLLLLLPVLYFAVFKYIPMFGNVIAFRKFVPGKSYFGVEWVGFKYFEMFITDPKFWGVFKTTIIISLANLMVSFPLPIIFSLMLNEIKAERFKKIVQSVTILPKFLSVVVVVMITNALLSPSTGIINAMMEMLGMESIYFLQKPEWFKTIYITSEVWQFLGWNSIIYMAALSGADQEQYEAALVDGANRWQQTVHITMPVLRPTIAINLIISVGCILNTGFEKILLMYLPVTYETSDVIQTFVYRMGIMSNNFSYATAISLFQGIISLSLLWVVNKITNKYWECGLW